MVRRTYLGIPSIDMRRFGYRKNYCAFYITKEDSKIVRIIRVAYMGGDLDNLQ